MDGEWKEPPFSAIIIVIIVLLHNAFRMDNGREWEEKNGEVIRREPRIWSIPCVLCQPQQLRCRVNLNRKKSKWCSAEYNDSYIQRGETPCWPRWSSLLHICNLCQFCMFSAESGNWEHDDRSLCCSAICIANINSNQIDNFRASSLPKIPALMIDSINWCNRSFPNLIEIHSC